MDENNDRIEVLEAISFKLSREKRCDQREVFADLVSALGAADYKCLKKYGINIKSKDVAKEAENRGLTKNTNIHDKEIGRIEIVYYMILDQTKGETQ